MNSEFGPSPEEMGFKGSFDDQFIKRELIKFEEGKIFGNIEIVDIIPERTKDDIPVSLVQGWGETLESMKGSIREMSEQERRVLAINHSRFGGEAEPKEDYPIAQLRKAESLLRILEEKQINKTDAVARSEGAINLLLAVLDSPDKFRNIVLIAPSGMVGKDSLFELAKRFGESGKQRTTEKPHPALGPASQESAPFELFKYVAKNPIRAVKEAVAISDTQIHEILKTLHDRGIGVSIIAHVDDKVFPMDRLQDEATKQELGSYIDGFYSTRGFHGSQNEHPEIFMKLADHALDAMKKKRLDDIKNE